MTTKAKSLPTQQQLQELFDYSIVEGHFYWKERPANNVDISKPAGSLNKSIGYRQIRIDGKLYQAHRLAWMYVTGEDPGDMQVDHDNGDRANNAFHNLQLLTNKQNSTKQHRLKGGSSKYRGVSWDKKAGKWHAKVHADDKQNNLGFYESEKDAATVSFLYSKRIYHKEHSTYQLP